MATAAEADTRYLTVQDVADRYRVSTQAVKNWIKAGKLGAAKPVGRQWLIEPEELARFEAEHTWLDAAGSRTGRSSASTKDHRPLTKL